MFKSKLKNRNSNKKLLKITEKIVNFVLNKGRRNYISEVDLIKEKTVKYTLNIIKENKS